jgi:predicted DNA-binding transcriptional regulator AlpA
MMMEEDQQVKYIRAKQLKDRYGIDRITAWRWSRDRSKAFPKAIRLAPNVSVYDRAEVDAWFEARKESDIR